MKPVIFITTFSETGYQLYGKQWIDTFVKYTQNVCNIKAVLYVDSLIPDLPSTIQQLIYDDAIPDHKTWLQQFEESYDSKNVYGKVMGKRFSYKAFVMMHALKNNPDCYVVWLDGDCVFTSNQWNNFPSDLLQQKHIACQVEKSDVNHIESGIVVFDNTKDISSFVSAFENNYLISNIASMSQPYDGFVLYKSLEQSNIPFNDLNEGYSNGGIQSDPESTFLNPMLKNRFKHNIGYTGKASYANWNSVKDSDIYFRLVKASAPKKTLAEIRNIKMALLNNRNKIKQTL